MFRHALISAAGSLLIVGGSLLALTMASANPTAAAQPQPVNLHGLPVTDLPGMTVYPASAPQTTARAHRADNHPLMNSLVQAAAIRATGSQLHMPYYSFGSTSDTAHVQTRKD